MVQSLQCGSVREKGVGASRLTSQACSFYVGVSATVGDAPPCEPPGHQATPALV
ncbi:hypothetical protein [Pantoea agglomerans]|uniref:hypothetical protein n=1 Tax=Enterobacter agglomerans TaxID=549 RepID=UPI0032088D56